MITPVLETERLILRPLELSDAEDIYERWIQDENVSRYMRWSSDQTLDQTREWIQSEIANYESDKSYCWGFVLKKENYLFGSGGLVYTKKHNGFEIGYNIMHKYWRQGLTTEAAKAIVQFAKETLQQNKLYACHAVENPASGAVMKKCGFQYVCDGIDQKFDGVTTYNTKEYELVF